MGLRKTALCELLLVFLFDKQATSKILLKCYRREREKLLLFTLYIELQAKQLALG